MQELTLFYTARVEAVTKVRKDSLGHQNIGVLIKNVHTKETEWVNSYNNFDLKWADYVCYELFSNNNERLTVIDKEAAEF
jgi:RAB protein geranylgeranyltransferase component A